MTPRIVVVVTFRRLDDGRTWTAEDRDEPGVVGTGASKAEALSDLSARLVARRVGGDS